MIYFASWDDSDNGETPLDYDSLQTECDDHTHQIHSATGDRDVVIGLNPLNRYEYEVWADGGFFYQKREDGAVLMKPIYFSDFEELRKKAMELKPDGDWEEIGWR
jgi:hypothetical protein